MHQGGACRHGHPPQTAHCRDRWMAAEESRKRIRVSQQSSSGAPEPAPDPFFNPLGDHDLSTLRKRVDTLAKAQELRDPIRRFAGESQSRIEQDLLMLQRGIGTKEILRRLAIYKKLVKLLSLIHI